MEGRKMIEVGEYVRIDKDHRIIALGIAKVVKTINETIYVKNNFELPITIDKNSISKHSKNIIDLIEVGDYVNGREVKHIAMFEGFPDYPKLIFVDETHLIPDDTCENEDIKTILTKESYMANCYKVGGEDEQRDKIQREKNR